ncbi:DNA polymerase alpha subunit B isoform X2 [Macrosteles quadrilineatus]|uniref:DNA polymerase alpha subunit B isoform X2 n=1 Tax=Macrosteles quadrilineatus TaxID=74068 RepID=UPI0023E343E6|nr:DNA polymerase alpha subunit B isoform X2 [Macrosteles quadrilineatus]
MQSLDHTANRPIALLLGTCGVEMCVLHNIDDEEFVESWAAYSVTNLDGAAPTEEALSQFERKELGKNNVSSNSRQVTTPFKSTAYRTPTGSKTSTGNGRNELNTTPKGTGDGFLARMLSTPVSRGTFSPASFSPASTTPSGKYSARVNAGEAVFDFLERSSGDWIGKNKIHLSVGPYRDKILSSQCRVMMETLMEKAAVLNDVIERIGSYLIELNGLQDPSNNHEVSPTEIVCLGRICCDSNDRLNASSVLLEGSQSTCLGHTVALDLSQVSHYSLFPGQIVAVVGTNPTGKRLHVTKLYHQALLPSPTFLPRFSGVMEVVIAAGPFTQSDSVQYEPLQDLMTYVSTHRPHVLILIGPLVDLRQSQLIDGSIAESYDAFTDKIISGLMDKLKGTWTQVVVVSSAHDAACLPIFPTPPSLSVRPTSSSPLHMVADPALLNISGLVLGVTATDSLMHLSKEELSFPPGGSDRLGRLASHLLQQQSFYPLQPPCEDLTVDSELWDIHACFPVTPHVLVVPSNLRYFIKHLHGCLVVNPEHLVKGAGGGTFARLEIEPPSDDDTWSPASHISAQIVKI